MTLIELLQQAGSAIGGITGPAGTALSGYLIKRILKTSENAESALSLAKSTQGAIESVTNSFVGTRNALKLDLDNFKHEVTERIDRLDRLDRMPPNLGMGPMGMRTPWPSRPDMGYDERIQELSTKVESLANDLKHERETIGEMKRALAERLKEDIERWIKMERWMGQLETKSDMEMSRDRRR